MPYALLRDANLTKTKALPASASTTVNTDGIDLGEHAKAVDVVVEVPALNATILPDTRTMTTTIEVSTASNFSPSVTVQSVVQTGASSAGAAAVSVRGSVPPGYRYARAKIVSGASTTDASAVSATFAALL